MYDPTHSQITIQSRDRVEHHIYNGHPKDILDPNHEDLHYSLIDGVSAYWSIETNVEE